MIVTVTANPSLDRTVRVPTITRGEVHRVTSDLVEPSGKGVNVSVALHAAGVATTAVLPVGGATGDRLLELLAGLGIHVRTVAAPGNVRSNVSVIEADGTTTKFNAAGAELGPAEVGALVAAAEDASDPGGWIAWCGSLPAGFGADDLAAAIADARSSVRLVALDTSGAALGGVLTGSRDRLPHLIKPNAEELAELVGRPLTTVGAVADAARDLVSGGVGTVLVSLGSAGAVLVDADVALHGTSRAERVVNTAGAGDAFLAGYLARAGSSPERRLASALRFGAAAVACAGTLLTDPPDTSEADGEDAAAGGVVIRDVAGVRDRPLTAG